MKCSTSKLAKNNQKNPKKKKDSNISVMSSDMLKDVKGCKETNSWPLHTNNI